PVSARVSAFEIVPLEQLRSLAINVQLNLLVSNVGTENEFLERELVLAVGRKDMTDDHAAAGSERLTFDLVFLGSIARCNIGSFRRRLPIAHCHARHF